MGAKNSQFLSYEKPFKTQKEVSSSTSYYCKSIKECDPSEYFNDPNDENVTCQEFLQDHAYFISEHLEIPEVLLFFPSLFHVSQMNIPVDVTIFRNIPEFSQLIPLAGIQFKPIKMHQSTEWASINPTSFRIELNSSKVLFKSFILRDSILNDNQKSILLKLDLNILFLENCQEKLYQTLFFDQFSSIKKFCVTLPIDFVGEVYLPMHTKEFTVNCQKSIRTRFSRTSIITNRCQSLESV